MRYRIRRYSDKHLLQSNGNSHPNLRDRHHGDQASCSLDHPTKEGEDLCRRSRTPTLDDLPASLLGLGDLVSRMIRCVVAADPTQEMTSAGLRHSIRIRTQTLHLSRLCGRNHLWNKAFAHDLVVRV